MFKIEIVIIMYNWDKKYVFKTKISLNFIPQIGMVWNEKSKNIFLTVKNIEYQGKGIFSIRNDYNGNNHNIEDINIYIDDCKKVGGWEISLDDKII